MPDDPNIPAEPAARLRANAEALQSWIGSMIEQIREEASWGRYGLEQQACANMDLGLRIASSLQHAISTIADHIDPPPPPPPAEGSPK